MKKLTPEEKIRRNRVRFQTEFWPAVAKAQGWNPGDKDRRRDLRIQCWQGISIPWKGDGMPENDDEATALFTFCRHMANPDSIALDQEWAKCCQDYIAYNASRIADHWEHRGFGKGGSRKLRENRFGGRRTAQGDALEDPLSRDQANQRLWKMRQRTREREEHKEPLPEETSEKNRNFTPAPEPEDDLIPF